MLKFIITWNNKKSLKILNGKSESVNQRTDTTIAKRKRTKGQTTIFKTLHIKLKIEYHEPHKKPGMNIGSPERFQ